MILHCNCRFEEKLFGVEVNFNFLETGLFNGDSLELQSAIISGVLVRYSGIVLVSQSYKSIVL